MQNRMQFQIAGKWKETYLLEGNDCEDAGLLFFGIEGKKDARK